MEQEGGRRRFYLWSAVLLFVTVIGLVMTFIYSDVGIFMRSSAQYDEVGVFALSQESERMHRIVFVNAYHEGYPASDRIEDGLHRVLDRHHDIELHTIRLDMKRNPSEEFGMSSALAAHQRIQILEPDLLIVSEDDAFRYLVAEYYRDTNLPVIFVSMNKDPEEYGLPYVNVTGKLQRPPNTQMIEVVSWFARGTRMGVLSNDIPNARDAIQNFQVRSGVTFDDVRFVATMDEWVNAYIEMQDTVDMIFLNNNLVANWDADTAASVAYQHGRVPTGTLTQWMMDVALVGVTSVPEEHGEWAGEVALRILNGESPSSIPIATNEQVEFWINLDLADRLDVLFPVEILKNAQIY